MKEAQKYANELLSKEGLETLSSPETITNGKRSKVLQKQKGDDKKLREQVANRRNKRQESPILEMDLGENIP